MDSKAKKEIVNKIYGWMLESLTEYVQENTDDDTFEEVYDAVWEKFQDKQTEVKP